MNAQIVKDKIYKFYLHYSLNLNGDYQVYLSLENKLAYLQTKFQKGKKYYEPTTTQINLKRC